MIKIELTKPIEWMNETIQHLEFPEPTVKNYREAIVQSKIPEEQVLFMLQSLTGIGRSAIDQIALADYNTIVKELVPFFTDSLTAGLYSANFSVS